MFSILGHDLATQNSTWRGAVEYCNASAACYGFTFREGDQQPTTPVKVYFKQVLSPRTPSLFHIESASVHRKGV